MAWRTAIVLKNRTRLGGLGPDLGAVGQGFGRREATVVRPAQRNQIRTHVPVKRSAMWSGCALYKYPQPMTRWFVGSAVLFAK